MIPADLIALGVSFYDIQRGHGTSDRSARHATVCYMRRKADDSGDAMPFYESLADALATRATAARIAELRQGLQMADAGGQESWSDDLRDTCMAELRDMGAA